MRYKYFSQWISYQKKKVMHARSEIIYDVISQTNAYQNFIPWCSSSKIIEQIQKNENKTLLSISFDKKFRNIQYVSDVKLVPFDDETSNVARIHSICKQKPLKYLDSLWIIYKNIDNPQISATLVQYRLNFSFDSFAFQLASSILNKKLGEQMWKIFEKQALSRQLNKKYHKQSSKAHQITNQHKLIKQDCNKNNRLNPADNIHDFMNKYPQYNKLYNSSAQFKARIMKVDENLKGTDNYQKKLQFQINNLMIYK